MWLPQCLSQHCQPRRWLCWCTRILPEYICWERELCELFNGAPLGSQAPQEDEKEFIYFTLIRQKWRQLFVCFQLECHVACQSAVKNQAVKLDDVYALDSRRLDGHFRTGERSPSSVVTTSTRIDSLFCV